jgi:hypothetical protein
VVTHTEDQDPPRRRIGFILLAIAAAIFAWLLTALIGPLLGTDAIWPFDRIGIVLAALAGVERLASRTRTGDVP